MPESPLAVDARRGGDADLEHEQRHGDGEQTVAERRQPLHVSSGKVVVDVCRIIQARQARKPPLDAAHTQDLGNHLSSFPH